MEHIALSVILPVYNEEESIDLVHQQVRAALENLGRSYEIIYVDDGSKDSSALHLERIAARDPHVTLIQFRRNFGQTAAMSAGIDHSQGDIIVLMDSDLQNDPNDIQHLLAKMDEGYDVVSGWRKNRQDANLRRKLPSKIANALIGRVTGVRLHDYGCSLKAYRREVLESVRLYGEMHRFIPAYAFWNGANITEIPVNHRARQYGTSKYNLSRTFRVMLDLITVKFLGGFATKPIYAFGGVGLAMIVASLISLTLAVAQNLTSAVRLHNNPLTLFGGLLFVLAIQTILLGLLAEMMMRTYFESQNKPTYVIRAIVGGAENALPDNVAVFARERRIKAIPQSSRPARPATNGRSIAGFVDADVQSAPGLSE
jgi:glycosyltransferase involved in cell wall biosynthesis